jgi:hypothetical protein
VAVVVDFGVVNVDSAVGFGVTTVVTVVAVVVDFGVVSVDSVDDCSSVICCIVDVNSVNVVGIVVDVVVVVVDVVVSRRTIHI